MKKIIRSPLVNAISISLFTLFYSVLFLSQNGVEDSLWMQPYEGNTAIWKLWSSCVQHGFLTWIAVILIGVTTLVVMLLIAQRRSHDEYHVGIITNCLVVAVVFTLIAIALFYGIIVMEPIWIGAKFTLFIVIHWITVVFANLTYILLCRRK